MRNHANFDARVVRPVFFVEIDAPTGFLRVNSSDRDIALEGFVFKGVGNLGQIGDYSATTGTAPTALRLTLLSIPNDLTQGIAVQQMRNRRVRVWMALLDGAALVATSPFIWFLGKCDTMSINVGRTTTVTLTATSRLINWARSANTRYTHEDQQKKYPADQGFKFVGSLATTKLTWGQ